MNKIEKQDLIKTIEAITNEAFIITSMEHKKIKLDEVVSKYNEMFHKNASRANIKYYTDKYKLDNVIDLNSDYNAMKRLTKEQLIEMIESFDYKPTVVQIADKHNKENDAFISKQLMRHYIQDYELEDMIKTYKHTVNFINKKHPAEKVVYVPTKPAKVSHLTDLFEDGMTQREKVKVIAEYWSCSEKTAENYMKKFGLWNRVKKTSDIDYKALYENALKEIEYLKMLKQFFENQIIK